MSDYRLGFSMEEEPFATIKILGVGGGRCNAVMNDRRRSSEN